MTELLTALSLIFIVAAPLLLLAKGLRLSAVPALIVAGLIVGTVIDEGLMIDLARLGIALLVFTFSVGIRTERLRTVVTDSEVVALAQAAILGAFGIGVGLVLGQPLQQALFIGVAAALSSTIVGTTLFQTPQTDIVHDYLSNLIDSVNDLLAVFILLVVGAGVFALDPVATQLGYGVLLLSAGIVVNRYLFGAISRLAKGSNESMLIGIIALLIVFLAAAEVIGVSIVVGAFAAGIAVRDDPVEYSEVLNGLTSIREFFGAIFFVTVGALVAIPSIDVLAIALALVILSVVVKPVVIGALLVSKGYDRRSATLTGLDLNNVEEFSVIVAIEAVILGLLLEPVFYGIILAAAISMTLSSFTHYYDDRIYRTLANRGWLGQPYHKLEDWNAVPADLSDHFVIVGYGRQGRLLVEFCENHEQPYIVIENNPEAFDDLRADCDAYVFGDALEREMVEVANLDEAKLIISTIDAEPVTDYLLSFTDTVDVIVRTREVPMAADLLERGAVYVIVSDLLAADQLTESLAQLVTGEYDSGQLREKTERDLDIQRASPYQPPSERSDTF